MEVFLIGNGPFHDPMVQWTAKKTPDGYVLLIGSEHDRIAMTCTEAEIRRIIRVWLEDAPCP